MKEMNRERKEPSRVTIHIDRSQTLKEGSHNVRNVGYCIFQKLYRELGLEDLWEDRHLESVFRFLLFSRILFPNSTVSRNQYSFFEDFGECTPGDVLAVLDLAGQMRQTVIQHSPLPLTSSEQSRYSSPGKWIRSFQFSYDEPYEEWTKEESAGIRTVCLTASILMRMLQTKLDNKYTAKKIQESLQKYICVKIDQDLFQFFYYDQILEECGKIWGIELARSYRTREKMQELLS